MFKKCYINIFGYITALFLLFPAFGNAQMLRTEPVYLFVQSAHHAKIIKTEIDNHYKIILSEIDPWVIYFTTQPHRNMGIMSINDFLDILKSSGKKYNPKGLNAVIVATENINIKDNKFVFTLYHPVIDEDKATVSYDAILVYNKENKVKPIADKDYDLGSAYIFIDACIGCIG